MPFRLIYRDSTIWILRLVASIAGGVFALTPISTAAKPDAFTSRMPSVAPQIAITSPAHGTFTTAPNVTVTGRVVPPENASGQLRLNGVPVALKADGTFTRVLPLETTRILHPILAEFTSPGVAVRSRIVIIRGAALAPAARVPEGLGLRLNASGMDRLEPTIARLVHVDPVSLLPPGPVFDDEVCIEIPPFGPDVCGKAEVHISHDPPPQFAQVQVDAMPTTELTHVTLRAHDLFVRAKVSASAGPLAADCKFDIRAAVISATGTLALEPSVNDPTTIDVIQQGPIAIDFDAFDHEPDCGDLPDEVVDRLISLFIGSVRERLQNGLAHFLNTVDAVGNTPLASALETALEDLSLERVVNQTLQAEGLVGLQTELPLNRIAEEPSGITLSTDTHITAGGGTAPDACRPPPGTSSPAPSYDVPALLPSLQPTTPAPNALPYDMALTVSISSLNQLLSAITTCGLLQATLRTIDVGGVQQPITAGLLSAFVRAFQRLEATTPLVLNLRPTLPPLVTEAPGPAGEAVDIRISQFLVEIVDAVASTPLLRVGIDLRLGLDVITDTTGALQPRLGSATEPKAAILQNGIGAEPASLQRLLEQLLALTPQLNRVLAPVTLPTFLNFALSAVAFVPQDGYLSLFVAFAPMP